MTLGDLGPILGNEECKHETVTYYNGIEGVYAVCHACHGHFWNPELPEGAEVIDLMDWGDDEEPTECAHGVPIEDDCATCDEMTERWRAYLYASNGSVAECSRPADAGDRNPAGAETPKEE